MYLVSYRDGQAWRAGVVQGGSLVDVAALVGSGPASVTTVRELLAAGSAAIERVVGAAQQAFSGHDQRVVTLDSVEVGPPVPDPDKILCLGLNYAEHAAESGMEKPPVPTFFTKFRNSLVGPTSPIVLPRVSREIDYEGELAVIIGRRCKDVSEADALNYVAGYSIMDDVSARDLQMQTSQWTAGKALDTFAPMGPGLVLAKDIPDPQQLMLTTKVNGQTVQHASTSDMLFSVAAAIAFISSILTLEPGDIIATGTPSGVGFKRNPPLFLKDGDVVEIEIKGVGSIRNPVVAG